MTSRNNNTRSVVITGASGGIGRALVSHLGDKGWRIFAGVRSLETWHALAADRPGVTAIELDVTDERSIAHAADQVAAELRGAGLDGLINNAGLSVDGPLELIPPSELLHAFAVNAVGPVVVAQGFLPLLRAARGRIVNMGGAAGRVALPMYGALSASKAALDSFSDVLRMELRHQGVSVSYVEPGGLATEFFARSAAERAERGYAGGPQAAAIYAEATRRVGQAMASSKPTGLDAALRAVEQALTARKAPARVVVGRDAKAITGIVRRLPAGTRDRAILRNLKLDAAAFGR
jgi:NAD(P)-dependent dehydrogenase (short-subunit alcohol dehydrogenase family)